MLVDRINRGARRVPVWAVWLAGLGPGVWAFYLGLTGGLGAEPIKALEHALGEVALQLLVAGLAITPLRRYLGINLIRFRRAIGLLAFTYVSVHLAAGLVSRPAGCRAGLGRYRQAPLCHRRVHRLRADDPAGGDLQQPVVRRLGPRWRRLHRLTYPAAVLGAVHFIWLAKGFQIEPLIYLGVISRFWRCGCARARRRSGVVESDTRAARCG